MKPKLKINEHGVIVSGFETVVIPMRDKERNHARIIVARLEDGTWRGAINTGRRHNDFGFGCSALPAVSDSRTLYASREEAVTDGMRQIYAHWSGRHNHHTFSRTEKKHQRDALEDLRTFAQEELSMSATELNGKKATAKPSTARRAARKKKQAVQAQGGESIAVGTLDPNAIDVNEDPNGLADLSEDEGMPESSSGVAAASVPIDIPIEKLHPHPANRKIDIPSCSDLAESMKIDGQLQPLLVRPVHCVGSSKSEGRGGKGDELPMGHYQIVGGERRYRAAMINGWETLRCVSREMDDCQTLRILHVDNAQREDLTDIEKGQAIALLCSSIEEGGAGMTRIEAGKIYSVSAGQASNLVRLLELPAVWQERLAKGELGQTYARCLLPYAPHKPLVEVIDKFIADEIKRDGQIDLRREDFEEEVRWVIGGKFEFLDMLGEVTDEERQKLNVVELPAVGFQEAEEVCLNTKLAKKIRERNAKQRISGEDRSEQKDAKPTKEKAKPPTKAELAKRRKEADRKTAEKVKLWRHRFLRCLASQDLAVHDADKLWKTQFLSMWLMQAIAKQRSWNDPELSDLLRDAAVCMAKGNGRGRDWRGDATKLEQIVTSIDADGDPVRDVEDIQLMLCKWILWPFTNADVSRYRVVAKEPAGDRLPPLSDADVEAVCVFLEVDIAGGWRRATIHQATERALVKEFFELHTKDQLVDLGEELGLASEAVSGKKSEAIAAFLQAHQKTPMKKPLPLPKAIAALKKPRKSPKRAAKKK